MQTAPQRAKQAQPNQRLPTPCPARSDVEVAWLLLRLCSVCLQRIDVKGWARMMNDQDEYATALSTVVVCESWCETMRQQHTHKTTQHQTAQTSLLSADCCFLPARAGACLARASALLVCSLRGGGVCVCAMVPGLCCCCVCV